MAWLTHDEIATMGFASVGEGALLSSKASYYNCENIRVGSHARIDDFCVLSAGVGGIDIGKHVHVAVFVSLIGAGRIGVADLANLSSRVTIYSSSDDFSGVAMTNPTIPAEFTNVSHLPVEIGRHVVIGTGSVVLPGVTLEEGVAVGAMSLVNTDCTTFGIYAGIPARRIAERRRDLLTVEQAFDNGTR